MKKLTAIILSLILVLSLAACGKKPAPDIDSDATAQTTEPLTTEDPTVRVTFPEGYTLIQIAEKLEENGVCPAADFMALTTDKEYLASLEYSLLEGIEETENVAYFLEGFVFPDTYDFYKGESAERAMSRFLSNTENKITDEYRQRASELGYTVREILALASVIQEEAGDPEEMPYVSSVVHNRLTSPSYGMLQCDVTIHYVNNCIADSVYLEGDTSVYAEHYNTYKCKGLPAGPICNPGIDAIRAALYPAETNYFFFVTDEDWNYYYAETYSEHQKNCRAVGIYG